MSDFDDVAWSLISEMIGCHDRKELHDRFKLTLKKYFPKTSALLDEKCALIDTLQFYADMETYGDGCGKTIGASPVAVDRGQKARKAIG